MLERLEDLELNAIADARAGQTVHKVALDDL
jgi:antitoxin StbD